MISDYVDRDMNAVPVRFSTAGTLNGNCKINGTLLKARDLAYAGDTKGQPLSVALLCVPG